MIVLASSLCSPAFAGSSSAEDADQLRVQAEQGDPVAQDRLGFMYYSGENQRIPRDYDEARQWFQKAAEQGNAGGQDHLGTIYYLGAGVPRDYAEALKWFLKAADQGNEHAERQLAEMYAMGLGVPPNHDEAKKWSRKVAQQNPSANLNVGFWLIVMFLPPIAFAWAMFAIQRKTLPKWKRTLITPFVHLGGVVLVLNSINTYGFEFFFPKCINSQLATSCYQYHAASLAHFLEALGDLRTVNLLLRFMMIVGFGLDVLAIWYLAYLFSRLLRRSPVNVAPSAP